MERYVGFYIEEPLGNNIFSYDEKSAGATDYSNATKELIQRI